MTKDEYIKELKLALIYCCDTLDNVRPAMLEIGCDEEEAEEDKSHVENFRKLLRRRPKG